MSSQRCIKFNCGFARCAIRELTLAQSFNKEHRKYRFTDLFSSCPDYGISEKMFQSSKGRLSLFDRHCKSLNEAWRKRWNPASSRIEYETTFSIQAWKALSTAEQQKHTLASCNECCALFLNIQSKFPLKPCYKVPVVSINAGLLKKQGKKEGTRKALKLLNETFEESFNTSFTKALIQHGEENLQVKPTKYERKIKLRKIYRKCKDKENHSLLETVPKAILQHDESMRSYQRKRLADHFQTPSPKRLKTQKSHSPDFSEVTWDKEAVLRDLQQHPAAPPAINWLKFAKEHNIPGSNAGQVAKEFAVLNKIDTKRLDGKDGNQRRIRMQKRRLHGGEISAPSYPTTASVKDSWAKLSESGQLSLGVPCAPFTLTQISIIDGEVCKNREEVMGRKFPLQEVRQKLLTQQEKYMRLNTDEEINDMADEEVESKLTTLDIEMPIDDKKQVYKKYQRTRSLATWHDHGTVLGVGIIMLTVHVVYDPEVFYTTEELPGNKTVNIQATIENPAIHMLVACTSSIDDQAAIIQDRIDCLLSLSQPLKTTNGIEIQDEMLFFIGDHPAQQFERGTQGGGTYKCGGCGVKNTMIDNLAHTLQIPRRSLRDLQSIAISGARGKIPGKLKPFSGLKVHELKQELAERGIACSNRKKCEMEDELKDILKGVQRVPTLLVLTPEKSLKDINLSKYTVLDCEPLHDMKGHLIHICKELPYILEGAIRKGVEEIISATVSDTMTCADHRIVIIQLLLYLKKQTVGKRVHDLLETAVRISQLFYLPSEKRTTKHVLRLYNITWYHHELCREIFTTFHSGMTKEKMFGTYLHAIVAHAPPQLEIVSLSSVNTEKQERIFSQARKTAIATSNRHAQNVITTLTLRLQAKAQLNGVNEAVSQNESRVAKAGKNVTIYEGTQISKEFVKQHKRSWEEHLFQISPYLVQGKGAWWEETDTHYVFHDSDLEEPRNQPQLLHFRTASLEDVYNRQSSCWDSILSNKIPLPASEMHKNLDELIPTKSLCITEENQSQETEIESEMTIQEDDQQVTICQSDTETPEQAISPSCDLILSNKTPIPASETQEVTICQTNTEAPREANSTSHQYNTKHAAAIAKLLGHSQTLVDYDNTRFQLKNTKKPTNKQKQKHEQLLAALQTMLQQTKTNTMKSIKKIEKQHYDAYKTLPSEKTSDELSKMLKQYKQTSKILALWDIEF